MKTRTWIIFLVCGLTTNSFSAMAAANNYTLYLVRHAEKQADGSRDPLLSTEGEQRSQHLAQWLLDKGIEDVWSSNFKRTRDTASPLQTKLGLKLQLYSPDAQPALVDVLRDRKHNALVVGHSNTIPELARLLCKCSINDMDGSEYDRLIVITLNDGEIQTETVLQSAR